MLRCIHQVRELLIASMHMIPDATVLGPAPLPVVKVNNRFRYRINIACQDSGEIRRILSQTVIECSQDRRFMGVSLFADNDPGN